MILMSSNGNHELTPPRWKIDLGRIGTIVMGDFKDFERSAQITEDEGPNSLPSSVAGPLLDVAYLPRHRARAPAS
jgi:hypothetical protein